MLDFSRTLFIIAIAGTAAVSATGACGGTSSTEEDNSCRHPEDCPADECLGCKIDDRDAEACAPGTCDASQSNAGSSYVLGSLSEPCKDPNDLTARDIDYPTGQKALDAIMPEYHASLFHSDALGNVLDGGSSALTINIAYNGGEIRCLPPVSLPDGVAAQSENLRVRVAVDVSFVTADGEFNESFPATLEENSLRGSLPIAALNGTFNANAADLVTPTLSWVGAPAGPRSGGVYRVGNTQSGNPKSDPVALWK